MKLDDRKLLKRLIYFGLSLLVFGFVLNFIVASIQKEGDFNLLGAWFSFAGLGVIIISLIYSGIKISVNKIRKK